MYTRDQMEEQLKAHTKAAIFESQFAQAFEKILSEKRSGQNQTYADKVKRNDYTMTDGYAEVKPFTVEGDDNNLRVAKWNSLLKDSAFYFDVPTLLQQRETRRKLQLRYDDLFAETMRFPLQSRRDLLSWACNAKNEHLKSKEASEELLENCENYTALLRKYGPDYDKLKNKLAHVRGLFD
eukprot:403366798